MASIPGVQLSLTGASGSQAALVPKAGWLCYVFPRGAWASADSSGSLITFDTTAIASRFAVNDWIQVGLATANLRKVSAVGGNSISVSGAAITVTEDNRVFLIGSTQPSTSGGSATYIIPATTIRHRDDDSSDRYTNSLVTTNSDGLIQFYAPHGLYDVLIQDANQTNQGYIADLPIGVAEGVSTSLASVFGATVTINAAFGVTGWATFGQTVTMNANMGVTGWATFGATVTMNANAGVSGTFMVGNTLTAHAAFGVTGWATFGQTVTLSGALGVTGTGIFGATVTVTGQVVGSSDISARRLRVTQGTAFGAADAGVSLSSEWGTAPAFSMSGKDQAGRISIVTGSTPSASPTVTFTYKDGAWPTAPIPIVCRGDAIAPTTAYWSISTFGTTAFTVAFVGTPVASSTYWLYYHTMGR